MGCSHFLYYPDKKFFTNTQTIAASLKIPQPEDVWFQANDGAHLHGWYFKNKLTLHPKSVIIFFHGNAQNISTHFASLVWLLDYSHDFFIFDYRGFGLSDGSANPEGTIRDGLAAIEYVHKRFPGRSIVLYGQSIGGAIALRTVTELKAKTSVMNAPTQSETKPNNASVTVPIRLVVVDSTFHSYQAIAKKVLSRHWLTWVFQPLAYVLISDKYAPHKMIATISPIPLIVIHGKRDETVEFEFGKKVFELAKEPKEFWEVPNGDHTDSFWGHQGIFRKKFLARLEALK